MKRHFLIAVIGLSGILVAGKWARSVSADRAGDLPYAAELDAFWQTWEAGRPSEAIRRAAPSAELQNAWSQIGRAADEFHDRSGAKCLGHSQLERKKLGDAMEYISILAHYDPTPLRVQMLYYKGKDKWSLIGIRVDSSTQRWINEAAGSTVQVDEDDVAK
jgi:hypothetical protein